MKKVIIIISSFGLIILLLCAFYFWLIVNGSGNTKEDKITSANYIKSLDFKGKISKVDNYNYSAYMFDKYIGITVLSSVDSIEYDIQFDLIKHPDLKQYIRENQIVIKNKQSKFVSIIGINKEVKTVLYPDFEIVN